MVECHVLSLEPVWLCCADNDVFPATLKHVLNFFAGADRVQPPLEFGGIEKPHLTFNHEFP